jgi:hypothetical protein
VQNASFTPIFGNKSTILTVVAPKIAKCLILKGFRSFFVFFHIFLHISMFRGLNHYFWRDGALRSWNKAYLPVLGDFWGLFMYAG